MFSTVSNTAKRLCLLLVFLIVLLLTACTSVNGEDLLAGQESGTEKTIELEYEHSVNGLKFTFHEAILKNDGFLVFMTARNESSKEVSLLLGGCGREQGMAETVNMRIPLYYRTESKSRINGRYAPGQAQSDWVSFRYVRQELSPAEVTEIEVHPGYVLNHDDGSLRYIKVSWTL